MKSFRLQIFLIAFLVTAIFTVAAATAKTKEESSPPACLADETFECAKVGVYHEAQGDDPENIRLAIEHCERACPTGRAATVDWASCRRLGWIYYDGDIVNQDYGRAYE